MKGMYRAMWLTLKGELIRRGRQFSNANNEWYRMLILMDKVEFETAIRAKEKSGGQRVCPVCGNSEIEQNHRFCVICGTELRKKKAPNRPPSAKGAQQNTSPKE